MDSSNIFTVTPMSQQIELEAGQTYVGYVTVANPANASADFNYQVNDRTQHHMVEIAEGVVFLFGVDHPSADQKK